MRATMNEKTYCKALAGLMLGCLPFIFIIPAVRDSKAAWPFAVGLVIGIAFNLLYIELRKRQKLEFISSARPVRILTRFLLCVPLFWILASILIDASERRMLLFKDAINALNSSEIAKRDLGSPFKIGWPIGGNTEDHGDSGHAVLRIPVSGSHGEGTLRVVGTKDHGVWKLNELTLFLHGGDAQESIQVDGRP